MDHFDWVLVLMVLGSAFVGLGGFSALFGFDRED